MRWWGWEKNVPGRGGEQHGKYPGDEIVHDTFKELNIVQYG